MVRRYYNLPSLTALAVFETCARQMNFNQAAMELNVTRGAVSRQIKTLEEDLGVALFDREAKGVRLTAEGETLYAVLAQGFSQVSETVDAIRTGRPRSAVTLACTNAFATLWLMRHMSAFWRQQPDINVHHLISDRAQDFRRADIDLRIRYGSGAWPDEEVGLLFTDRIFPVCGPTSPNVMRRSPLRTSRPWSCSTSKASIWSGRIGTSSCGAPGSATGPCAAGSSTISSS